MVENDDDDDDYEGDEMVVVNTVDVKKELVLQEQDLVKQLNTNEHEMIQLQLMQQLPLKKYILIKLQLKISNKI